MTRNEFTTHLIDKNWDFLFNSHEVIYKWTHL